MTESDELARLGDLHQQGKLSDEEFARAKARVLNGAARAGYSSAIADGLNAFRRSRSDRWLGGVCGGIARLTDTPSWVWRLLFALLVLCAGTGVLLYLLMWIFVPADPLPAQQGQQAG
jgi:phage shock protein C